MALIDLKSDLSKFRMPKKDPLVNKKRESVNMKQNQTPLNALLKSTPSINTSEQTPTKQSLSLNKFSNSSNFLGETTPNKFTFNPNHEDTAKTPKRVDFFPNDNATGFTFNFNNVDTTKFVGVNPDNTIFDSTNSLFSNFSNSFKGIGFSAGYEGFKPIGKFTGDTQRYNPDSMYTAGIFSKTLSKPNNGLLHLQTDASAIPFIASQYIKYTFDALGKLGIQAGYANFRLSDKLQGGFYLYPQQYTTLESRFTQSPSVTFTNRGLLSLHQDTSFFKKMYNKFHLKDDSPNYSYPARAFKHPLILRGIQAENGVPDNYGQFGLSFDDGLIRGGTVQSTQRAAIDVVRITNWLLTPKGLAWSARQTLQQLSNRYGKVWNFGTTLTSVASQHLGIHPNRSSVDPLGITTSRYMSSLGGGGLNLDPASFISNLTKEVNPIDLEGIYTNRLKPSVITSSDKSGTLDSIGSFVNLIGSILPGIGKFTNLINHWKIDVVGGFDALYGISIPGTVTSRFENTFSNKGKTRGDVFNGGSDTAYIQKYNPFDAVPVKFNPQPKDGDTIPKLGKDGNPLNFISSFLGGDLVTSKLGTEIPGVSKLFGLVGKSGEVPNLDSVTDIGSSFTKDIASNIPGLPGIKDYTTLPYDKIPERDTTPTSIYDFRKDIEGNSAERSKNENYDKNNLQNYRNFGNQGRIGPDKTRTKWWNYSDPRDVDYVNNRDLESSNGDPRFLKDIVTLGFYPVSTIQTPFVTQFRGTISGLSDTFSPSWGQTQYNGRADLAYNYTSFERSVSFSFKVIPTTRVEMRACWNKLQYLSTMTMPEYVGNIGYQGTLVRFRLGDLYKGRLSFIESLTYTMMDETPWEMDFKSDTDVNHLGELPMGINVSITLKILGGKADIRPALGIRSYDWDFPSAQDVENSIVGAIPGGLPGDPFSFSGNDQEIIPNTQQTDVTSELYGANDIGGGSDDFGDFLQQPESYTVSDGF
jgi:hypothetical protein